MPMKEGALRSRLSDALRSAAARSAVMRRGGIRACPWRAWVLGVFLCAAPLGAHASPVALSADYTLSIAGITMAEFRILGNFDGPSYIIGGTGDSRSVTSIIAPFQGRTKSEGRISDGRISPQSYLLDLKISNKRQVVSMNFERGKVSEVAVRPQMPLFPTAIPLKDEHQKGVLDPISAVVIPLPDGPLTGPSVCNRNLPIFDGSYRYDMTLSYKRLERLPVIGKPNERTDVYVCKLKYLPIAGHRPNRKSTVFWATNEDIEIWLTPLRSAGVLIPYRLVMPTPFGQAVAAISRITLSHGQERAAAQ